MLTYQYPWHHWVKLLKIIDTTEFYMTTQTQCSLLFMTSKWYRSQPRKIKRIQWNIPVATVLYLYWNYKNQVFKSWLSKGKFFYSLGNWSHIRKHFNMPIRSPDGLGWRTKWGVGLNLVTLSLYKVSSNFRLCHESFRHVVKKLPGVPTNYQQVKREKIFYSKSTNQIGRYRYNGLEILAFNEVND